MMGPDTRAVGFCGGCHEGVLSLQKHRVGCIPKTQQRVSFVRKDAKERIARSLCLKKPPAIPSSAYYLRSQPYVPEKKAIRKIQGIVRPRGNQPLSQLPKRDSRPSANKFPFLIVKVGFPLRDPES